MIYYDDIVTCNTVWDSALAVFSHNALYKSTFYLLTYLLTYLSNDNWVNM